MAAILSMGKGVNWFVQKYFQNRSMTGANQKVSEILCTLRDAIYYHKMEQ